MSKANPTSESSDAQSGNEENSGIVITNGPDGLNEEDESPEPDTETEQSPEEHAGQQAEQKEENPEVEEEAEVEESPSVQGGENSHRASESVDSEEDATESAEVTETDTEGENEGVAEEEPSSESDPEPEDANAGPETETKPEPEPEPEPEAEESNTDDNDTNMTDTDTDTTAQTESSSEDLTEISGAPGEFEATIQAGNLQELIDSVDVLVDECKVRLGSNAVGVRAVDPANVGMVDVELEAEAFESYHTDTGVLGVNLDRFADVVGLGSKGDLVHLNYDAQTRKLHISVGGVEYTLAMIDPDSIRQEPDIPDLQLPVEVTVDTGVINQGVTAADMVSDHIALGTQRDGRFNQLVVEAEGDTDDVELVKGEDDDALVDGTFNGDANSLFSLDYLKDMNKALPKNGVVTLEIGDEFPVKMHFDNDEDQMHTTFMLAPRIQSD